VLWLAQIACVAQLEIVSNAEPQRGFFGHARKITLTFHNSGNQIFSGEIHAKNFQTSSATAVLLNEFVWKKLQMLPQQTILESAQLDFPVVKAETKFVVQWLENSNVLGTTEVLVYPTNLLNELQPLVDEKALGIFDPQNQLKPLLKNLQIEFEDLENSGLTNFSGKLAIIGPFRSRSQEFDDLSEQIKALAKKNVAVVWILPDKTTHEDARPAKLLPSFYSVPEKQTAVVIVQPDLVSDLAENPQSQLNLIYFCKLALNPHPPVLPDSFSP
jgi:hypothetical protein